MDPWNSSPIRTRLLPYPRDTYFYPEGPTTMECNRTKNMEGGRMNEERRSEFFNINNCYNIIFLLLNQKFQKKES